MVSLADTNHRAEASELRQREGEKYGGSAEGIRQHYDLDTKFWHLVLGCTLTYSCAMFVDGEESLDDAQQRKIDWHIRNAGCAAASSVLDIGCGWGSILRRLAEGSAAVHCVGLTLSQTQFEHVRSQNLRGVKVRLENWAVHEPAEVYDSIVSVGAFEHFAKPEETEEEKISVYRDFFARCHSWLRPSGRMTLQTMAFGNMKREAASEFMNREVFPDSDLPFFHEIVTGMEGRFEIVSFRNDRLHYARTYDRWATNLRRNRAQAVDLVGEEVVARTERYFKLISMGFRIGKEHLLRFVLRPVTNRWALTGADYWDLDQRR